VATEIPGEHAMFGDGTPVVIKLFKDKGSHWEIGMRTNNAYEKYHGITDRDKDVETGLIYREYPKIYFHLLNPDPVAKRWLIACSFDNKPTNLMTIMGKSLYDKIREYQQLLHASSLREAHLRHKINLLSKDPLKVFKKDVLQVFSEVGKIQLGQGGGTSGEQ